MQPNAYSTVLSCCQQCIILIRVMRCVVCGVLYVVSFVTLNMICCRPPRQTSIANVSSRPQHGRGLLGGDVGAPQSSACCWGSGALVHGNSGGDAGEDRESGG